MPRAVPADDEAPASGNRFVNPRLDPVGLSWVDQRSDLGLEREGIPHAQRPDPRGQAFHELSLNVGVYENTLGGDTDLTGMVVCALSSRSLSTSCETPRGQAPA